MNSHHNHNFIIFEQCTVAPTVTTILGFKIALDPAQPVFLFC